MSSGSPSRKLGGGGKVAWRISPRKSKRQHPASVTPFPGAVQEGAEVLAGGDEAERRHPRSNQRQQQQPTSPLAAAMEDSDSPTRVLDYDAAVAAAELQQLKLKDGSSSSSGNSGRCNSGTKQMIAPVHYPKQQHSRGAGDGSSCGGSDIFRPPLALHYGGCGGGTSSTSSTSSSSGSRHRMSRQYFSSLPTLDETSSSGSQSSSSFDDDEVGEGEENERGASAGAGAVSPVAAASSSSSSPPPNKRNSSSPKRKLTFSLTGSPPRRTGNANTANAAAATSTPPADECSVGAATPVVPNSTNSKGNGGSSSSALQRRGSAGKLPARKSSSPAQTFPERMAELQQRAQDLAACGEDQGALLVYKKALKLSRHETGRVKNQLNELNISSGGAGGNSQTGNSSSKKAALHPSALPSIASRLHEDWLCVGRSIADVRCQMAVLCERVGEYDRALACCMEASGVYKRQLAFLEKNNGNNPANAAVQRAEILRKAEEMKIMLKKMQLAKDSFSDRKMLHEEIIVLRRALGAPELSEGEKRKLHARLQEQTDRALALEMQVLGPDHPQVADTLSLLSTLACEIQGDMTQAFDHLRKALEIVEKSLGTKHPLTGEMLLQMARLYATQTPSVDREAISYYERAVEVFLNSERNPKFVGSALNEVSVIYIRQRKYEKAITLLQEALDAFAQEQEQQKQDETQEKLLVLQTDSVQIWRNLGECYAQRKEFDKASNAFVHALDLQRDARKVYDAAMSEYLLADNPPPPSYLVDDSSIADTLRRLGKSYVGSGKHAEALAIYSEALLIHRSAVVKAVNPTTGRPNEGLPERQDQLAHTLFCIAEVRELMGDAEEALRIYSESMQLRLFSDAHRQDRRQNMVHCAMCLRGIGNVHLSKNEFKAAHKVFEDALSYCVAHGTFHWLKDPARVFNIGSIINCI